MKFLIWNEKLIQKRTIQFKLIWIKIRMRMKLMIGKLYTRLLIWDQSKISAIKVPVNSSKNQMVIRGSQHNWLLPKTNFQENITKKIKKTTSKNSTKNFITQCSLLWNNWLMIQLLSCLKEQPKWATEYLVIVGSYRRTWTTRKLGSKWSTNNTATILLRKICWKITLNTSLDTRVTSRRIGDDN